MSKDFEEYTVKVFPNGDKEWWQNGDLHRLDGPAIEYADGDKLWYQNGEHHRLDGPAVEYADGDKYWFQNGDLHRLDGPAIEYADGSKYWYIEGEEYTEDDFNNKIKERNTPTCLDNDYDMLKEFDKLVS